MTERNLIFVFSAIAAALLAILLLPFFKFNHHHPTRGFLKWSNSRVYADLVVTNATIYTSDPSLPFAEAMAVRNGRILRVGDYDSIKYFICHTTRNLNLHGKVVVPGFIDSHVHFLFGGLQPDHILDDAGSAEKKNGVIRAQKGSYLFQSLLAGNAQLAFGSDWPVADINPLRGIQTAVARVPHGWNAPWIPMERFSLNDALNSQGLQLTCIPYQLLMLASLIMNWAV